MTPTKTPKLLLLIAFYCSFMLLEACNTDDCPSFVNLPFMTFDSAEALPNALSFDESGEEFAIEVRFNGIEYVAYNVEPTTKWLSTSMYGCTPAPHGGGGFKNPLTAIDITALEDFDMEHPAGTLLNNLFEANTNFVNQDTNLATLIADGSINLFYDNGNDFPAFVMKDAYPTNAGVYNFMVKLFFENGDSIELTLEPVTFN